MKTDTKTFLKHAWTFACVSCFILPLFAIPFDGWRSWLQLISRDMAFGMVILSFPAGVFYLLGIMVFTDDFFSFDTPVSSYVLLWFGFFVIGYLQWFHLLPYVVATHNSRNSQNLTTLGLNETKNVTLKQKSHRPRRSRRARPAAAQLEANNVLEFDEIRRTPLERVISEN